MADGIALTGMFEGLEPFLTGPPEFIHLEAKRLIFQLESMHGFEPISSKVINKSSSEGLRGKYEI